MCRSLLGNHIDRIRKALKAWRLRLHVQRACHADLELRSAGDSAESNAKHQLFATLFALKERIEVDAHEAWLAVYSRYLNQQLKPTRPEFKPLFQLCSLDWPPTREDMYRLLSFIAQSFLTDERKDISIDETVKKVYDEYGCNFDELGKMQLNDSRKAVFVSISWLTMLVEVPLRMAPDLLQITLANKVATIRSQQSVDDARLPLARVMQGFGPVLPTSTEVSSMVNSPSPTVIHAACFSVESLIRIDRIRIVWTDSLGSHLLFDPLSRILSLYRYPSICALNNIQTDGKTAFEA